MFYNMENLFDTIDDPHTSDQEYLPNSKKHWNSYKYYTKLKNMSKVLIAAGEWDMPAIIGMCEIENKGVLVDLCKKTALRKFNYQIIHNDSPDPRGIDVAALYQPDKIKILSYKYIPISYDGKTKARTREILQINAIANCDTFILFINHWPSRMGGEAKSSIKRFAAARSIRNQLDSIALQNAGKNIILMGDFNDEPDDVSMTDSLVLHHKLLKNNKPIYTNLSQSFVKPIMTIGTHKYRNKWGVLDQCIVSNNLLNASSLLYTKPEALQILDLDFITETNEKGRNPLRTFTGVKYTKGYSDHYPIVIDLYCK